MESQGLGEVERIELENKLEIGCKWLLNSARTVASTGAGISRESGIPTFRGEGGIWKSHRPEELATREGFLSDPDLVWRWYRERLAASREKEPNEGHLALAELENLLPNFLLITQNVDNLHRRAGSRQLVELHGNIERYRCLENSHPARENPSWADGIPRCHCGSVIRPDVVWFGEPLPAAELECAFRETQRCTLFLLVGASGMVQPAAMLPYIAKEAGAKLIEVNASPSEATPIVDLFLQGQAGSILPALFDRIRAAISG